MKVFLIIFFLLVFNPLVLPHDHSRCYQEESNDSKPIIRKISLFEKKWLQSQQRSISPIRITIDAGSLKSKGRERDLILKTINLAIDFLSKRLKILSTGGYTVVPSNLKTCSGATVPSAHRSRGFNGDLILYVISEYDPNSNHEATATYCAQDPLYGRPIVGRVKFNTKHMKDDPSKQQYYFETAIHEIIHVLGFHDGLFESFKDGFGSTNNRGIDKVMKKIRFRGVSKYTLITPKLVQLGRKYFSCPTLEGIDLEDSNGPNTISSHWEKNTVHNDLMTPTGDNLVLSEFTLALLEDSGWYKPDYSLAGPMYFGKGAGCDYFFRRCSPSIMPNRTERCYLNSDDLCTYTFQAKGSCRNDKYTDDCPFVEQYSGGDCEKPDNRDSYRGEYFGRGSRCIMGNIIESIYREKEGDKALCYEIQCENNGRQLRIKIRGSDDIVCKSQGSRLSANKSVKGSLVCPDPKTFCENYYRSCPNDCSSRGFCVDGQCDCPTGWAGADCSTADNATR